VKCAKKSAVAKIGFAGYPDKKSARPMKTPKKRLRFLLRVLAWVVFANVFLVFIMSLWSESYFWPYPSIDTKYAPGFSEEKFGQIKVGMSQDEVFALLGKPLGVQPFSEGTRFFYSEDGAAPIGDFAWLGRLIDVKDGKVTKIIKQVFYD
jgi:outer membrane protein assembly factor BamE (lipoprotein component of BamABCDE complex)